MAIAPPRDNLYNNVNPRETELFQQEIVRLLTDESANGRSAQIDLLQAAKTTIPSPGIAPPTVLPALALWPAANRAIYVPFVWAIDATLVDVVYEASAASGNMDVGIYDESGVRLVSSGNRNNTAGINTVTLSYPLTVGKYYLGMVQSSAAAPTILSYVDSALGNTANRFQMLGVKQEALGSAVLPATATFANPASAYMPVVQLEVV